MPAVKLKEYSNYTFTYNTGIGINELNYRGIPGASELTDIVNDARIHLLSQLGMDELNPGNGKSGIVVKDIVINFLSEASWGDKITVCSAIDCIYKNRFRIFHRISSEQKKIALVETGIVSVNRIEKRKIPVPQEFILSLKKY